MKDNLDGFQKLVLIRWTFSISIGLKRRDPKPYLYLNIELVDFIWMRESYKRFVKMWIHFVS